eukprot:COSAG05_NODE_9544_length_616_cov_3.669246_1_plen_85_part_10
MSTYPHVIESYVLSYICLDRRQALMHSDGEDYYEICTFLYHTPCEHPLETPPLCEQLVAAGLIWGTYNPTNQNNYIHTVTHRLES